MKHHAPSEFRAHYNTLPADIKTLADRAFARLIKNPRHPSLHFKRIGECWSVRVGMGYRALGRPADGGIVWFWIGSHEKYCKLLRRLRGWR